MMVPTAQQVLRCVSWTLDHIVRPDPTSKVGASALVTASHLLRFVDVRLQHEARVLADDAKALQTLLGELQAYFESLSAADADADADAAAEAAHLAGLLSQSFDDSAAQAAALGEGLYRAQKRLHAMRDQHRDDAGYQRIRSAIRDYIAAQLTAEGELVERAFRGHGPRR